MHSHPFAQQSTAWNSLVVLLAIASLWHAGNVAGQEADASTRSDRPGWYLGRQIAPTMSASGADWLIRKTRDYEEQPRTLLQALDLKRGQQVCDFGCGNGFYSMKLAGRVGPSGKVFAVDIQPEMLELLVNRAQPRGLRNIETILSTPTDPKLPTGKLDLVLMVDVYHELSHPTEILRAVQQSLAHNGRVVLVEYREEDPEVPIRPLHKMSQQQVVKEMTANQFKLVGQFDELPWQHVLFFASGDATLSEHSLRPWQPAEWERPAAAEPDE